VVVAVGVAVTEAPVVALRPDAGVQLYVVPPEAVNVALVPEQILEELTEIVGVGVTLTGIDEVTVQPEAVALIIYD